MDTPMPPSRPYPWWPAPAAVFVLAVALRIAAFRTCSAYHADELFQYLEQAHRIVFGYGIVPWEYRYGMRSWLVPLLLSGPMRIGAAIDPAGDLYLVLARAAVTLAALAPVVAAYAIGARISRLHGLVAMAVMATWYETVFFSVHVLTETLAFACFLPAAALVTRDAGRRRLFAGGLLLGATIVLRVHYAPAVALFGVLTCGRERRCWPALIAGGLAAAAGAAAIDLAMGQAPFGWVLRNVQLNLVENRAADYGVSGPYSYLLDMAVGWRWAGVAIALLVLPAIGRHRALFYTALAVIGVHMLIGHKEYRFILLATQILVLLAAIGSAELIARLRIDARLGFALAVVPWAATSAALGLLVETGVDADRHAPGLLLGRLAAREPRVCGLATYYVDYWAQGGYAYVHRPIPLYVDWTPRFDTSPARMRYGAPAFNAIIAPRRRATDLPPGYRATACAEHAGDRLCLYERPGGCDPAVARDMRLQSALEQVDL